MNTLDLARPGISTASLARAGVRTVNADEARELVGFAAPGLLIPYVTRTGSPVLTEGRPFYRLRLERPTGSAKYLSPAKSGCQLYEPPGLRALLLPGSALAITEGEFKALALVEAGFPCVGVGGISSACPGGELLPALAGLIAELRPHRLDFIGDADTALIYDFSREAVKLATAAGLPVSLPRIPFDSPGKAPDDLRELWADTFPGRWREIVASGETVTAKTCPAALAVRLLRREQSALAGLAGDGRDRAREKLVRLAAAAGAKPLARADLEGIASDALGLARATFRAAIKEAENLQRAEAAERAARESLANMALDGSDPLAFDGQSYWRKEHDGNFGRLCREDARLHLNKAGLSKSGDPAPADAALHELQRHNRVDYAGPLCGRPSGLHTENGKRLLVTRGPTLPDGKPGEFPTVAGLLSNLFGAAAKDTAAPKQLALFFGWLKLARSAVRHFSQHQPGQVLALVGPPDCGKSLLQSMVITPALGGRAADASLFLVGGTPFNSDLWEAEHLQIGDKALDLDGTQRAALRNELKRVVAEADQSLHAKHRPALTMRPVWRVTVSANEDPESASNLPALDASFADKIIYLKCHAPPAPFFDPEEAEGRANFVAMLRAELAAFVYAVDAFEIPADLRKARFGITEWHHPAVLELIDEGDPLRPIDEVLAAWVDSWPPGETSREVATIDLYAALDSANENNLARHKISTGPKHLGHQMSKLSKGAWIGRVIPAEWRLGGRQANRKQRGWRIAR